jgi:hypothetical protein
VLPKRLAARSREVSEALAESIYSSLTPQRSPRIIRNLPRRRSSPAVRSATKQRQLPAIGGNVVTHNVEIALRVLHLEVPVIRCQPAVNDFRDLDMALAEPEPSRRLLATIAGVALDIHFQKCRRFS